MTQQEYENKIKELQDELEQLKATKIEAEQPKRWKPNQNQAYWAIARTGRIENYYWVNDRVDDWLYLIGDCFKTEEEAEEYRKQIEYTARYKNYIEEHSEAIDWSNNDKNEHQTAWGAYYDYIDEEISVDQTRKFKEQGKIYASSEQIIWDAIKEIGEDNFKKYVLEVK